MNTKKYLKLLRNITDEVRFSDEILFELQDELAQDTKFIKFLKTKKDWKPQEHDGLLRLLDLRKSDTGFYLDKYGKQVSYDGIRTLKRAHTELPLTPLHEIEQEKCKNDFLYFRGYYCFIMTKTGLARPEPREYQKNLEKKPMSLDDTVILFSRQSGKCVEKETKITVRDDETGEIMKLTIEEFHNMIEE